MGIDAAWIGGMVVIDNPLAITTMPTQGGLMAASQSDVWTCRVEGVVVGVSGWRRVGEPVKFC